MSVDAADSYLRRVSLGQEEGDAYTNGLEIFSFTHLHISAILCKIGHQ